jgi:hypothetical protein
MASKPAKQTKCTSDSATAEFGCSSGITRNPARRRRSGCGRQTRRHIKPSPGRRAALGPGPQGPAGDARRAADEEAARTKHPARSRHEPLDALRRVSARRNSTDPPVRAPPDRTRLPRDRLGPTGRMHHQLDAVRDRGDGLRGSRPSLQSSPGDAQLRPAMPWTTAAPHLDKPCTQPNSFRPSIHGPDHAL